MMAAVSAAEAGAAVTLLERNEKLGKKIYITGKGRCNFTNNADTVDFFDNVFVGTRFSYSSVYGFDAAMLMDYFANAGLRYKIERGGRVFPESDKASDVTRVLTALLQKNDVDVRLNCDVRKLLTDGGRIVGVETANETLLGDRVILCCGGKSYPTTGSDGYGYELSRALGHKIISPRPALVPLISNETWVHELAGLSLVNVEASLYQKGRRIASRFGELLFTHKGVSGPVILTLSCLCEDYSQAMLYLDLKPALSDEKLDARILRDFSEEQNRAFKNSLNKLLPASLAAEIVILSGIDPEKRVNQITAEERKALIRLLKHLPIEVSGTAGFKEAIITAGGVDTKEVNPSTLESKLVSGLYFAGELINMHAFTGGFNLQLAFSSGRLAGLSAAEE